LSRFAIVTRDELWSLDRRALLESRLMHGSAESHDNTIDARDDLNDELLALCDRECERVRESLTALSSGRARAIVSAQSPLPPGEGGRRPGEGRTVIVESTVSISILDLSIVTTLPHLSSDYEMLVRMAAIRPAASADYRDLPVLWRNGSGAVLLHEAAGHPAEHGHTPLRWPSWLTVTDESEDGPANLLRSEAPRAWRRKSFTDVPLRRMTNVVVGARSPALEPPPRRIEVLLLAGGRYEPLTESVELSVAAANLIDGDHAVRLRPFVIQESRATIAKAIRGAAGEVRRYPGVVCSREGQELFVASYSPDLLTEF
jgi:hypothetical protein